MTNEDLTPLPLLTYLPISLSLKDKKCLVIGGGQVALRKIENLLDYECRITVIAPDPAEKIEYFAKKGRLTLHKREYKSPEASQYSLVISATSERRVNQTAAQDAKEAGVLVNVTDDPVLCDFVFPAVLKRGSLSVAVSTDGKSPFLAGHLRAILEDIFPEHWNQIAEAAALFREKVRRLHPRAPAKQAACYEKFIRVDWKKLLQDKSGPVLSKIFEDLVQ